jgi:dTDP-glucose 4,6-dehydratase/UDP-glucuronate decarboxylase
LDKTFYEPLKQFFTNVIRYDFLKRYVEVGARKADQEIEKDCLEVLQSFDQLNVLDGKTFLITGSNGLIGNYLVTLLDVANKRFNTNIKAYCLSKHPPRWRNDSFTFITQDLSQPFQFEHQVDYIIHAACYARPEKFLSNELETIALNVNATQILLEVAKRYSAKFLFLSSSEIYGNPPQTEMPTKETYPGNSLTSSTRAAYVESKRLGEALCFIYHRNFRVEAKVARLASVYGPGISLDDERVMGNFMKKALIDGHIQLLDSGRALRTYCYITDAVRMLLNILLRGKENIYNVGGIETISILDLARLIAQKCGATYAATPGEGLKDAPDIVRLDVTQVREEFGIKEFTSIEDGLTRTIEWNKQQGKRG